MSTFLQNVLPTEIFATPLQYRTWEEFIFCTLAYKILFDVPPRTKILAPLLCSVHYSFCIKNGVYCTFLGLFGFLSSPAFRIENLTLITKFRGDPEEVPLLPAGRAGPGTVYIINTIFISVMYSYIFCTVILFITIFTYIVCLIL